jgi:hypothetical protein
MEFAEVERERIVWAPHGAAERVEIELQGLFKPI